MEYLLLKFVSYFIVVKADENSRQITVKIERKPDIVVPVDKTATFKNL